MTDIPAPDTPATPEATAVPSAATQAAPEAAQAAPAAAQADAEAAAAAADPASAQVAPPAAHVQTATGQAEPAAAPAEPAAGQGKPPATQPARSGQGGARRKAGGPRPARGPHPLLHELARLHPQLFGARFRPLKLGIFEDLQARHPGAFEKEPLKAALGQHARSTPYLECVAAGDQRHDLDGKPVEPVAPEHRHHAIMEVFRRRQARAGGKDLRPWLVDRLAAAIRESGLDREAYLERVRTSDPTALEALQEVFDQQGARKAKNEALRRAYEASGRPPIADFAQMYGLDEAAVREAVEG